MAGRICPRPRCPVILTNGERYCITHAREYEANRGSRQQRGYGSTHDRARAMWQGRINSGHLVRCATCSVRIIGRDWDLGHNDDRTRYLGPQCEACNRSEGGKRAHT